MILVTPSQSHLASYIDALRRGWSPDNLRPEAGREELARIEADVERFIELQDDREAKGLPIELPDGTIVNRIPGYRRWMWDGEFSGVIGFRWQPGTNALPPHVLGHIGFSVVPWKRRRGYATRALELMLEEVRAEDLGLTYVELTTDVDNVASQRVITANGGALVERFNKPEAYGGAESYRFRIAL